MDTADGPMAALESYNFSPVSAQNSICCSFWLLERHAFFDTSQSFVLPTATVLQLFSQTTLRHHDRSHHHKSPAEVIKESLQKAESLH